MTPPIWLDEHGRPLPPRPCPRCGREPPVHFNGFRIEHLKHVAWRGYHVEAFVNCAARPGSHPVAPADGSVRLIPVEGEAG